MARSETGSSGKTGFFGFEELRVYQAARTLVQLTYRTVKKLPDLEKYALGQQMRRAAVSIIANIAEGNGRHHRQEASQFCRASRGSLMELADAFNVCLDQAYMTEKDHKEAREAILNVLRLLNGYITYLQEQKAKD